MNLTDPIYFQAKLYPERPALGTKAGVVTYGMLVNLIEAAGSRIQSLGFSNQDLIGLNMQNTAHHLIIILALARLGIPSVSSRFDSNATPAVDPTAIFVEPPAQIQFRWRQILVDQSWLTANAAAAKATHITPSSDDAALTRVILSSGTTGIPRAIRFTPSNIKVRISNWSDIAPNGSPEPRYATFFGFDTAIITSVLRVLWQGGFVLLRIGQGFLKMAEQLRLTEIALSPAQLSGLVERQSQVKANLTSLQRITVTGARMPSALVEATRAMFCKNIVHFYGATEAGVTAMVPPQWKRQAEGEAGFVVPWKRVEIVDDADQVLAHGEEGRIRIRGDDVVDGYYVDRPENKDNFRDGCFYPGDVGVLREDGMLIITGRVTEIINRGGFKIAPSQVEGVLSLHPAVADTVVIGAPDAQGREEVWAAIVRRSQVSEADLMQFCRDKLPSGKLPNHFIFLDAIPRNDRGKPVSDRLRQLIKEKSER